ncbi:hypothetical protein ACJMK2_033500 [Sinanodonta woodiana]|uniref:GH18 domain-containing protein n=1 Tax=Sinanodonta woodiana TaxID=1069815 RepID=A0ABD3WNK3_SINWO
MAFTGFTILVFISANPVVLGHELWRVCYYSSWSLQRSDGHALLPEDIDANLCTHINFAFTTLDSNGTEILTEKVSDFNLMQRLNALKTRNPALKTLISLGGWEMGSVKFHKLVATHANMNKFAQNAINFLRAHNFDGLDVDWEYPAARGSPATDKHAFSELLMVLHNAFAAESQRSHKNRLLLTTAVAPTHYRTEQSYDVRMISRYCDFINMMMYDFHGSWDNKTGPHSALYSDDTNNINHTASHWEVLGAQKDKLVIGVPFYGKVFTLLDPNDDDVGSASFGGGDMPYYLICKALQDGTAQEIVLNNERVPYMVQGKNWVTYDNPNSLREKVDFVKKRGYGGIMVWAIDLDDTHGACGHKYPLMNAVVDGIKQSGSSVVG